MYRKVPLLDKNRTKHRPTPLKLLAIRRYSLSATGLRCWPNIKPVCLPGLQCPECLTVYILSVDFHIAMSPVRLVDGHQRRPRGLLDWKLQLLQLFNKLKQHKVWNVNNDRIFRQISHHSISIIIIEGGGLVQCIRRVPDTLELPGLIPFSGIQVSSAYS